MIVKYETATELVEALVLKTSGAHQISTRVTAT